MITLDNVFSVIPFTTFHKSWFLHPRAYKLLPS